MKNCGNVRLEFTLPPLRLLRERWALLEDPSAATRDPPPPVTPALGFQCLKKDAAQEGTFVLFCIFPPRFIIRLFTIAEIIMMEWNVQPFRFLF